MKYNAIKKLLETTEGKEITEHLKKAIKSVNRLDDIPSNWSDRKVAVEVKARRLAAVKLAEILKPIIDFQDLPEVDEGEYY